jgi:hypothetical protein
LWVWSAVGLGALASIVAALVFTGATASAAPLIEAAVLALLGVTSGVGAFGVRNGKRPYNVVAVVSAVAWIVVLFFVRVRISRFGIAINLAALAIVASQWRRFTRLGLKAAGR